VAEVKFAFLMLTIGLSQAYLYLCYKLHVESGLFKDAKGFYRKDLRIVLHHIRNKKGLLPKVITIL
jgi:hypothetical protein